MVTQRRAIAVAIATLLLTVSACAASDGDAPAPEPARGNCVPGELPTRTTGQLTIATGQPAPAPWFLADRPESGEGFEAAVAYAVAGELGYDRTAVSWTRVGTEETLGAGEKSFDLGIGRFAIGEQGKSEVDYSAPYYLVRQAVVARKSTTFAGQASVTGLRGARLGARSDSTGWQAVTQLLKPTTKPQAYRSDADGRAALLAGRLDGIVVDLPTAFRLVAEAPGTVVVGQVAQVGAPQALGLVLARDSALTDCVSRAIGRLRDAGTLAELERRWVIEAGAPELT